MQTASRAFTIEQLDLPSAPEPLVAEVAALRNALQREYLPDDPPVPAAAIAARARARPKMFRMREWLARDAAGTVVAQASLGQFVADTNKHLREAGVSVLPAHRRRGIGRALYREVVRSAGDGDDIVFEHYTNDRVPAGEAFARRIGAHETLRAHVNQLDLRELDRDLVREWSALRPGGYRLEWIDADVPDALVRNVIVAYDTMNTAPRGESGMEDWHHTPELIREWDRSRREAGRERRLALVIDEATGDTAGFTELTYDPKIPHVISQQGTAVIPAHRGRGLGKWLKAAMLARALREWPNARFVRTGNADANAPMLAINTRLGFAPVWASIIWEIGIGDARRYAEGGIA